jgi:hypothetical protein
MVKKYPPTLEELKRRRMNVPQQEELFFNIVDALDDNWYVWHSVNWDNDAKKKTGEADFLIFHPNCGFLIIEVKGGIISINNAIYYSLNQSTLEQNEIKDPFEQARRSMHHIREFYVEQAKKSPDPSKLLKFNKHFPLSFNYGVFFPDTTFKDDFEYLQLRFTKIFDQSDFEEHMEWMAGEKNQASPLERFLLDLLNAYASKRISLPSTAEFFISMIGSNISKYVSMRKYLDSRETELEEINKFQDYLLNSLSQKSRCIFKGSAGSGKTFIAMKKALLNYRAGIKTLVVCFNVELRASIQNYLSEQLDIEYEEFKDLIHIHTINSFLRLQINENYYGTPRGYLLQNLDNFDYRPIAFKLKQDKAKIYKEYKYDAIIVDEAQDIDSSLWDLFDCFLNDPQHSILYIFYDEAQSIFVNEFSTEKFGMNSEQDLIILSKNLRNTTEIAKWFKNKTKLGNYQEFSGIKGFKVTTHQFNSSLDALIKIAEIIKGDFINKNIDLDKIAILSYFKLNNLGISFEYNEHCEYIPLYVKEKGIKTNFFVVEPDHISNFQDISKCDEINSDFVVLFKTISGFKGLERDVIFLLVPTLSEFKERYPERYNNFIMKLYVGASRSKFKLYFFEYSL